MKVSELTGAQLDYWVARALGIPADQLKLRPVPGSNKTVCVHSFYDVAGLGGLLTKRVDYSSKWETGGPLIEKHDLVVGRMGVWHAIGWDEGARGDHWIDAGEYDGAQGDTPLRAVCRAVVRSVFGDEVEEVAAC